MATKVVLRFNGFTAAAPPHPIIGYTGTAHAFGFSEALWRTSGTDAQTTDWIRTQLAPARAFLLPSNVTLTDALLYTTGGGRGVPVPLGFVGSQPRSDQVNVAALCSTRHPTAPAQRRWWVHCLPDLWVIDGELHLTNVQATIFGGYLARMNESSWLGLIQNNLQTIISVSAAGLVSLPGPHVFTAGQLLRVTRTLNAAKRRVGGNYFVSSIGPGLNNLTLTNWNLGETTSGSLFRPTYDFYSMGGGSGTHVERAGTKRVGRPFDLYRGRQPANRA